MAQHATTIDEIRTMSDLFTKRPISHDEAVEALKRFENGFWKREPGPRVGIPARRDYDDDLVLHAYIHQQRNKEADKSR